MKTIEKNKLNELLNKYQIENNLPELKIESLYSSFTPKIIKDDTSRISESLGIDTDKYIFFQKTINDFFKKELKSSNSENTEYDDRKIFDLLKKMNFKHSNELFLFTRIYQSTLISLTGEDASYISNIANKNNDIEKISKFKMKDFIIEFSLIILSKNINPENIKNENDRITYLKEIAKFISKKDASIAEAVLFTDIVTPDKM